MRYLTFQMERALNLIDENVRKMYCVDILSDKKQEKYIWSSLEGSLIEICCRHTKIVFGLHWNTN